MIPRSYLPNSSLYIFVRIVPSGLSLLRKEPRWSQILYDFCHAQVSSGSQVMLFLTMYSTAQNLLRPFPQAICTTRRIVRSPSRAGSKRRVCMVERRFHTSAFVRIRRLGCSGSANRYNYRYSHWRNTSAQLRQPKRVVRAIDIYSKGHGSCIRRPPNGISIGHPL